ncbi:uncharacterized protein I303_101706 [Kwoniella dejecticola CBS 10117]|uniref:Pheromone a factor receptor n=1 Tax=Kwoniella dejecticola CBS 10117 TaxID=1296121 RepID=A0A1A6AD20_9TREE|nr:uncharacterized protein I303_02159 [Kwoniella dejecticola CBS 10117]OBR87943.1 hypothetical protein I303_02159 [Kwoniella dejecticola CBS 10117]
MHDASLTLFAGLSIILALLPLPVQWRARNSGTLLLITWLLIGNITTFVNGIVWWDSLKNVAPIWCDICAKLSIGLPLGITASSLCITRRLVMIASSTTVTFSQKQKQIALMVDLFLGIVFPIIIMIAHYAVQPHRFDIFEGYGCQATTWISIQSIVAVTLWPVVTSLIAAVYGAMAIKLFLSRRLQFQTLLRSSKSGLDSRDYVRLMALASVDILIALPLCTFSLAKAIANPMPYESWAAVHYNFSRVIQYPASQAFVYERVVLGTVLPRWFSPLLSIIFFLFFGVSIEAMGEYSRWVSCITSRLPKPLRKQDQQLPSFVPKLGSTIARPPGGEWKGASTVEESIVEETRSSDTEGLVDMTSTQGVAVAVRVERQVV